MFIVYRKNDRKKQPYSLSERVSELITSFQQQVRRNKKNGEKNLIVTVLIQIVIFYDVNNVI